MNIDWDLSWKLLTVAVAASSPFVAYLVARKRVKTEAEKLENDVKKFKVELEDRYRGKLLDEKLSLYSSVGRAVQDLMFRVGELAYSSDEHLHKAQSASCVERSRNLYRTLSQGWHIVPTELLETAKQLGITIGRAMIFKKRGHTEDAIKELEENTPALVDCFRNTMRKDIGMSETTAASSGAYFLNLIKPNCDPGEEGLQE